MTPSQAKATELLFRALQEPYGLLLQVSELAAVRTMFYQVRARDRRLARLQFRSAPRALAHEGNLVIVRGVARQQPSEEAEAE